jgi:hypothetical protein
MMRRSVGLAIAGALAASMPGAGMRVAAPQVQVGSPATAQPGGSMTAPQGGIGSMLGTLLNGSLGGPSRPPRNKKKGLGWSVAEAKRRAVRKRNKLRSKGQFRKAVR